MKKKPILKGLLAARNKEEEEEERIEKRRDKITKTDRIKITIELEEWIVVVFE